MSDYCGSEDVLLYFGQFSGGEEVFSVFKLAARRSAFSFEYEERPGKKDVVVALRGQHPPPPPSKKKK